MNDISRKGGAYIDEPLCLVCALKVPYYAAFTLPALSNNKIREMDDFIDPHGEINFVTAA